MVDAEESYAQRISMFEKSFFSVADHSRTIEILIPQVKSNDADAELAPAWNELSSGKHVRSCGKSRFFNG